VAEEIRCPETPLRTKLTVVAETPLASATSRIVARRVLIALLLAVLRYQ
jgi:hypothetical protein